MPRKASPRIISVDTETTGLDLHHGCQPFFVSTHDQDGKFRKWEWYVNPFTREVIVPEKDRREIASYLQGAILVFHNAKFDIRAFATIGIFFLFQRDGWNTRYPEPPYRRLRFSDSQSITITCPEFHDTTLLSHVHSSKDPRKLKDLAIKYLSISDRDEKELKEATRSARLIADKLGWMKGEDPQGESQTEYDYWMPRQIYSLPEYRNDTLLNKCEAYAEKDTYRTIGLYFTLTEFINSHKEKKNKWKVYNRERDLLPTLYKMETFGFPILADKTVALIDEFEGNYKKLLKKANDILRKAMPERADINAQSDFCLRDFFFVKYKLEALKVTEKAKLPSCDKESLQHIRETCANTLSGRDLRIVKEFLDLTIGYETEDKDGETVKHPGFKQFKNAAGFLDSYLQRSLLDDNGVLRLHPSLNQIGTGTTRLSSSSPNGQNIPTRSTLKVRKGFGPPPGKIWYAVDYSQLQLRIFAQISGEESLIQAFIDGHDFHTFVSEKTGIPRNIAKNVNFAIIFGAGENKVDSTAGKKGTYKLIGDTFPNVDAFITMAIEKASKDGYILTEFGYPLEVPHDTKYKAANYWDQGTEGDICKNAMIQMDNQGLVNWIDSRIVFQVHDEVIVECDATPGREVTDAWANSIGDIMEKAGNDLGIRTPVEIKVIENNWNAGVKIRSADQYYLDRAA